MKNNLFKYIRNTFATLTLCVATLLPATINAQDLSFELSSTIVPVVEDKADIFTDYEEIILRDKFTQLRDETGYQFIFMTVTDTIEYGRGHEVETMYNSVHGTLYGNGSVLFLISTDEDNLICEVQAYSYAKDYLTYEICDYMNKKMRPFVENKDYNGCMDLFFDLYNQAYEGTLDTKNITTEESSAVMSFIKYNGVFTAIALFVSLAITITCIFIFTKKLQPERKSYSNSSFIGVYNLNSNVTTDRLTYIRSRVSK